MSSSSPEDVAAILKSQTEARAVSLWSVGMFCILGWDCLTCLPKEIKYIWRRRFSHVSWFYIANRYLGLIIGAVGIWVIELANSEQQKETYRKLFLWQPITAMVLIYLSQAIMASRVYALYGGSKIIMGILAAIMLAEFVVHTYTASIAIFPSSSPDTGVSYANIVPLGFSVAFCALPLVFDTVTFILTLSSIVTFWRQEAQTPTIDLIFRDGLIYFAVIFSMNLINVVLFVTQDPFLQSVNLIPTVDLGVIMTCRLVLNLRRRPTVHMSGASSYCSRAERSLPIWNTPSKTESEIPEFDSPNSTPVVVADTTGTHTHIRCGANGLAQP